MIKHRQGIKNSNENTFFCYYLKRNIFTRINKTVKGIEQQMLNTTQMEAILKGFLNVMDSLVHNQFKESRYD